MTTETNSKVLARDEVKVEETWRLEDIFATDERGKKSMRMLRNFQQRQNPSKEHSIMEQRRFSRHFPTVIHCLKDCIGFTRMPI